MELHRVDAGLIDGEVRTARRCAKYRCRSSVHYDQFQRIAGGSGLSG